MKHKVIRWWRSRNYDTDICLSNLLQGCIKSGVQSLNYIDRWTTVCVFNNGLEYTFWNTNIPYAWCCQGVFKTKEEEPRIVYSYDCAMPSKKVMNQFYDAICQFVTKESENKV